MTENILQFTGARRVHAAKLSERFGEVFVWPERDGTYRYGLEILGLQIACTDSYPDERRAWLAGHAMLAIGIESVLDFES